MGEIDRQVSIFSGSLLAALGLGLRRKILWPAVVIGGALIYRGLSGSCKLYQALGLSTRSTPQNPRVSVPGNRGIKIERMIMIHRSPEEVYKTWRNFENLPHFMSHLKSVTELDATHSRWVAQGPMGQRVEWDAEVFNERENELIAWRSLPDSGVASAGTVRFAAAPGGTEVRVSLEYNPPGGIVGAAFARLFHEEPSQQIRDDLRRFKQLMEVAG